MPPRYAYWTILVDGQPTAFRAAMEEDLLPTFNRLQQKHPSAEMKWFQNGKLWGSRLEAQEAMQMRGDRGRMGDKRQGGGFRDRKRSSRPVGENFSSPEEKRNEEGKLDWKPKDEFTPAPKSDERSDWKPRGERSFKKPGGFKSSRPPSRSQDRRPPRPRDDDKLEWKPKGEFTPAPKRADRKPDWKPKGSFDRTRKPDWKSNRSVDWTPKSGYTGAKLAGAPEKRKWIPKEEYKKSQGIEARRDKNWRPGGEHKDPRQKYKDAKKAKWTKFKKNIRQRSESRQGTRPPKKRRDEE